MTVMIPEAAPVAPPVTLSGWVGELADAHTLADALVASHFVPQAFKPAGRSADDRGVAVANATGAILLGRSLGLDPLTALQQIYVVHGRPGIYAKLKVALAQGQGHRIWEEARSDQSVTVCGQRRGTDDVVRITVTMDDAKRAGWTSNDAYRKTPADMLWSRAAGRVVDRVAADVLFGLASVEDLEDEPAPPPRVTATIRSGTTNDAPLLPELLRGKPFQAPVTLESSSPPAPEPEVEPEVDPAGPISERTWAAINAALLNLGVTGPGKREKRLMIVSHLCGRPISKGSDLTTAEAGETLAALQAEGALDMARHVLAGYQPSDAEPDDDHAAYLTTVDEAADAAHDAAEAAEADPTALGDWGNGS